MAELSKFRAISTGLLIRAALTNRAGRLPVLPAAVYHSGLLPEDTGGLTIMRRSLTVRGLGGTR